MKKRVPYGSKMLRVVLAARDLYEFTTQQLTKYARVDPADFDNAKRPDAPLELGKVIVECSEIKSARGRSAKVYTFASPEVYEGLREWIKRNYRQDEQPHVIEEQEIGEHEEREVELTAEDNARQIQDSAAVEKKIEQILLFITKQSNSDTRLIWASRGLRYLAEWAKANHIVEPLMQVSGINSINYVKYEVYRFHFLYFLALDRQNPDESLKALFDKLLTAFIDLEEKEYLAEYLGLVDVGLKIIDRLFESHYEQVQTQKGLMSLSSTWEKSVWEVWATWFEHRFRGKQHNELIRQIYTYWLGSYQLMIKRTEYQPSLDELLSTFPSARDELAQRKQSRDRLSQLLQEFDRD